MKFTDEGYIINLRRHGERSAILSMLTAQHGKVVGYVKNCISKKTMGTFQLGNKLAIDCYSRVDENMLSLKPELITPGSVNFLADEHKLRVLSCFCSLSNTAMPELQNVEELYTYADNFMQHINFSDWLRYYILFEFYLLDFLGIGLDLSECASCHATRNLIYISPKSGKSVCSFCGEPYRNRLYSFPEFIFHPDCIPTPSELKDSVNMLEFFLYKNFFCANGLKFPKCRDNLAEII